MSKDLQTKFQSYLEDLQSQETDSPDSIATVAAPDIVPSDPSPSDLSGSDTAPADDSSTPPSPATSPVIVFDTETPPQSPPVNPFSPAGDVSSFVTRPSPTEPNRSPSLAKWLGGGLLLLLLGGGLWLLPKLWVTTEENRNHQQFLVEQNQPSEALKLVNLPPQQRDSSLQAIANQSQPSLDRSRARFLLASDLLDKYEGGSALKLLEGLENDYPVMAPYIVLKRARGYELSNEKIKAKETWQGLVENYPDSPVMIEALYQLGKTDPQYWQKAIAEFPHHPRTLDILLEQLRQNPQQPGLMAQIVAANPQSPRTYPVRDRLLQQDTSSLTPETWQAIADSYWYQRDYKNAAKYYGKAPETAQNLYRLARSQHLSSQKTEAIANYRTLIQKFPDSPDTAKGITRFVTLIPASEVSPYLDQVIQKFPDQAPDALLQKAKLLDTVDSAAAAQAYETLLKQYSNSNAAAQYRWRLARQAAKNGDITQAWQWAQELAKQNPDSNEAPKAIFWIGKWAQQLNRPQDAQAAFTNVLARHPQSYYAWRSAVMLGWKVGDFNSVRSLNPPVQAIAVRPLPPAGSDLFKELYRLGQDSAAISVFDAETQGKEPTLRELTIPEQFTDALLKLAQNQYLVGINQILDLRNPSDPEQDKQWRSLRESPDYWQALFPFPYQEKIFSWAQKRNLNPFLVTALIRQESRFEKDIRSPVGATGLMQVMPATAEWIAPQINLKKYSLTDVNDNLNLGTWYFDHTHDTYNNNSALAVASYNAGPGNVAKWLKEFQGNDPDRFVENIPFAETKGYVESVFGNYWNYLRIYDPEIAQLMGKEK